MESTADLAQQQQSFGAKWKKRVMQILRKSFPSNVPRIYAYELE